jgi:hypothetical protein
MMALLADRPPSVGTAFGCGQVGRAVGCGVEDRGDLAEVLGAEDAGGDDRERLRIDITAVVEVVDGAAWDAERLARANIGRCAFDRPVEDAREPVDSLFVPVVAVRGRDAGSGWNAKTATDPADYSPSIRNRIANSPTVISFCVLAVILDSSPLSGKVT